MAFLAVLVCSIGFGACKFEPGEAAVDFPDVDLDSEGFFDVSDAFHVDDGSPGDGGFTDSTIPDVATGDVDEADGDVVEIPSDLGAACETDADCVRGLCVPDVEGSVCSEPCGSSAQCGDGWICAIRTDDGEGQAWCWPDVVVSCAACESDAECGVSTDACVELEGLNGCAQDCSQRACGPGYVCSEVESVDGATSLHCLPELGTCSGCLDRDGDGYGVGVDCLGLDCDDDNPLVYFGAPELCDGIDNSCDGIVDMIVEPCYSGPEGTEGVGECEGGNTTCVDGEWSECVGEVTPRSNVCNGLDNTCDGDIDQFDAPCYDGPADTRGEGICRDGVRTCTNGIYSACVDQILPGFEVCDGQDNNCNGEVDEVDEVCYTGPAQTRDVGICRAGTRTCLADGAGPGACEDQVLPQPEQCNNQDDNCDGVIDNFNEPCYDGPEGTLDVGLCRAGVRTCTAGEWGSCADQVLPTEELCDGQDNNCDGVIDDGCECVEGATQSCYSGPANTEGVGLCRPGTQTCTGGAWGSCEGQVLPTAEVCDGEDNNCNGEPDSGLSRVCYDGPDGTVGVGICTAGVEVCTDGQWGECQGQVLPEEEVCDGQDNDCNGTIDSITRSCYSGPDSTEDVGVCRAGTQLCTQAAWGTCSGEVLPADEEICGNGQDDTCTGTVDDGCPAGVDRAGSSVTTTSQCLTAGTGASLAVVVDLFDTDGEPMAGATVTMTTTGGTLSAVVADGATYHAILTAPAGAGSAQITASADGQTLNTRPTVTFAQGITDVHGGAGGCATDGNVRVRVVDPEGAPISGARVMVGGAPSQDLMTTFDGAADGANTAVTNATGYATLVDFGAFLRGPVTVTAGADDHHYLTMVDVDASDFVIPIAPIEVVGPTGSFTGDMTPFEAPRNDPIELGIQLPNLSVETLATFSLGELLGDNQCYSAGGFAGNLVVPSNLYFPQQCAVWALITCGQTLPKKNFISTALPYGPNRLVGLGGAAPLNALTGDITAALGELTFESIGVAGVDVNAPGPTTRNISNMTNLSKNASCTISNHPANTDVFCAAIGDWDSGTNSNLRVGEGNLFLQGFRTVNSASLTAPFTIGNIPTVPSSGSFAGIEYAGAAIATYLDQTREGIPAGTEKGISVVLERAGTVPNAGGGTMVMNDFFPIRPLTRTERTFEAGPLAGANHPDAHYNRTIISREISETYTACETDDSTRRITRELWRVYSPGSMDSFTLPTLPTDWPGGSLPGDLQGLIDPDATPEDDKIVWQTLTIHEGFTAPFAWDDIRLGTFRGAVTHISVNSADF